MSVGGASWSVCCRFFFQAEDGIRDVAVTGVQTCALPISRQTQSSPFLGLNAQPGDSGKLVVQGVVPGSAAEAAGLEPGDVRSEERRVGKEGGCRWAREACR